MKILCAPNCDCGRHRPRKGEWRWNAESKMRLSQAAKASWAAGRNGDRVRVAAQSAKAAKVAARTNRKDVQERIKQNSYRAKNGCLIWTGYKADGRYAYLTINGKLVRLARWLLEQQIGTLPKGVYTLHSCDEPACIELTHLRSGTPLENNQDMVARGRARKSKKVA